MSTVVSGTHRFLPFIIPATELAAGTAIEMLLPEEGVIEEAAVIVQTAIVTGGAVTFAVGTTAVDGLSLTVADAAPKGAAVAADTPTKPHASRKFVKGDRLQIVPSAAFNGGGALAGYVKYRSSAYEG